MAIKAHHFNRLLAHAQRNYTFLVNNNQINDILGSHGYEYENYNEVPIFWRNLLPPF